MTWTKLSDDFSDDCWTLTDAEFRTHSEALIWSNRKLLNCVIPKEDVARFKRPDAADGLVAKGFWRDAGESFVIAHHSLYQRDRDAVIKQQEANRKNGAKGGRPAKPGREATEKAVTQSVSKSLSESVSMGSETQSLTESQSESKTERDRTGQASRPEQFQQEEQIDTDTGEVVMDWPAEIQKATTAAKLNEIYRSAPAEHRPAIKARGEELGLPQRKPSLAVVKEPIPCTKHGVPGCTLMHCRAETGAVVA